MSRKKRKKQNPVILKGVERQMVSVIAKEWLLEVAPELITQMRVGCGSNLDQVVEIVVGLIENRMLVIECQERAGGSYYAIAPTKKSLNMWGSLDAFLKSIAESN